MAVKKYHWAFVLTLYGYMTLVILVESSDPTVLRLKEKGFLDVRYNGTWGYICYHASALPQFDKNAAMVVCKQMGFSSGKEPAALNVANLGLNMVLRNATCTGDESSFGQCDLQPNSKKCFLAITVVCKKDKALNGLLNATFLGDDKAHEGILQVTTQDGTKREVCYDSATNAQKVSEVVCKQMNYSGFEEPTPVNSSSSTSFYDASCQGTEQTLATCTPSTLSTATTCSSGKVINVQCKLDKATQRRFDIRLSSPNNSMSEGTVEVYQYGRWGVICDTDWDIHEAEVVCRELGYKSAKSKETGAKFGQGTGVVFWNKMQCNAYEPSIANCIKDVALGTQTCDSANAAGVVCDTERFTTIDICSNKPKVLEAGVTLIQSKDQPKHFAYSKGQTCFLNLTSPTNFTVYIYKKMFEKNHVEHLSFISADRSETLYGDDSRQGPFDFSSGSLTIVFNADTASGEGVINIMVSVAGLPPPTPTAVTITTNGTNGKNITKSGNIKDGGGTTNVGKISGAVFGGLALIATVSGIVIFLIKRKKIKCKQRSAKKRKSSGGSYENNVDVQELVGVEKTSFTPDLFAANPQGNGVIPGNGAAKEPETGETETKVTTPTSDSGMKVVMERASTGLNANELDEFPKGGVLTIHAPSQSPTLGSEEPVTKEAGPQHFIVSGPGNQENAMVNKPRMGTKLPPLSPPKLSQSGTVPPKNLDGPRSPYVAGENLVKDQSTEPPVTGVSEYNPKYQDVEEESNPPFNKPNTFMPVSAAYADVELGEASKIQDQSKQKESTKKENKKHGKDKKKPEKEKKKKWRKDKKESKENMAEDAAHAPVGNDSCAVPMRDDFDMPPESEYAEVGAREGVGQINPVGQPEQNNSETYDHLDFKGRKTAPHNPGNEATYDTVHRL